MRATFNNENFNLSNYYDTIILLIYNQVKMTFKCFNNLSLGLTVAYFLQKKKTISVKNEFFSKTISLLEIIPIVIVLSRVKLRVRQRQ